MTEQILLVCTILNVGFVCYWVRKREYVIALFPLATAIFAVCVLTSHYMPRVVGG